MARILIADDNQQNLELLETLLRGHGHEVITAPNGIVALEQAHQNPPDMLVTDILMPEMDGFEVLREVRKQSGIPVVMLTARGDVMDRVVGLELGADDYLPKPFEPRELVARVQNILKRMAYSPRQEAPQLKFEHLEIDPESREVVLDGNQVKLTGTEYELLLLLATNPGVNLTRDDIINRMKGVEAELFTRAVDIAISRIRNKLQPHDFIRTVRGVGYAFTGKPVA